MLQKELTLRIYCAYYNLAPHYYHVITFKLQ